MKPISLVRASMGATCIASGFIATPALAADTVATTDAIEEVIVTA